MSGTGRPFASTQLRFEPPQPTNAMETTRVSWTVADRFIASVVRGTSTTLPFRPASKLLESEATTSAHNFGAFRERSGRLRKGRSKSDDAANQKRRPVAPDPSRRG